MNKLNVLSLFDGLSGARIALDELNIDCNYYASEIDKYALEVSKQNYPDIIHLGDITKIKSKDLSKIDLLIGGSPCQDLSLANNNRTGLNGLKSKLFFEYVRLLKEIKPKCFLLENVESMKQSDCDIITKILKVKPIMINSAKLTAQNRKRYYWFNNYVAQPKDAKIFLKDILEKEVAEKYYLSEKRYKKIKWLKTFNKVETIGNGGQGCDIFNIIGKSITLDTGCKGLYQIGYLNTNSHGARIYNIIGKSVSLNASTGGDEVKTGLYLLNNRIRKLTPVECERLQGIPDNYTNHVSNTQRYKMIGNGFTVPVIKYIISHLKLNNECKDYLNKYQGMIRVKSNNIFD